MVEQLKLPGFDGSLPSPSAPASHAHSGHKQGNKLLFALFPSKEEAQHIHERAQALLAQHRWTEEPIAAEHLHLTLQLIGDYPDAIPKSVESAAMRAAEQVRAKSFQIKFDQVQSLSGPGALVFQEEHRNQGLQTLLHQVSQALVEHGFARHPQGTPHMTLLFSHGRMAKQPFRPISWTAHEFVLIHSHGGNHRLEALGKWALTN
nr:2'-5' RNA ligase family protein [uncultured Roseateles sp.]